jgi:serine/threonine protein kinase
MSSSGMANGERESKDPAEAAPPAQIQPSDLEATLESLSTGVKRWEPGDFAFIKTLQDAVRNHGSVDLMEPTVPVGCGRFVRFAVKKMPTRWVRQNAGEFKAKYPNASERPWHDMAFVKTLHSMGFLHVCELIDIFRDEKHTYVATQLCTEGDLFGWCDQDPRPGKDREAVVRPVVKQICSAMKYIHSAGIAHRDLSLENILLTPASDGQSQVKIIDFGMATLNRFPVKEVRGKQSYQAPEMHSVSEVYDAFLTDMFAVGVVIFAMSVQDYPWVSTKEKECQLFDFCSNNGLAALLQRRKLRRGDGEYLAQVMTKPLADLVSVMLAFNPLERATFGEPCYTEAGKARLSVWDMDWLQGNQRCEPSSGSGDLQ